MQRVSYGPPSSLAQVMTQPGTTSCSARAKARAVSLSEGQHIAVHNTLDEEMAASLPVGALAMFRTMLDLQLWIYFRRSPWIPGRLRRASPIAVLRSSETCRRHGPIRRANRRVPDRAKALLSPTGGREAGAWSNGRWRTPDGSRARSGSGSDK